MAVAEKANTFTDVPSVGPRRGGVGMAVAEKANTFTDVPKDVRPLEVPELTEVLAVAITELDDRISLLIQRIEPVRAVDEMSVAYADRSTPRSCALGGSLDQMACRILNMRDRVANALEHLQI